MAPKKKLKYHTKKVNNFGLFGGFRIFWGIISQIKYLTENFVFFIFYIFLCSLLFNTPHLPKVKKIDLLQQSIDASLLNTLNIQNHEFDNPKENSKDHELPNINVGNFEPFAR